MLNILIIWNSLLSVRTEGERGKRLRIISHTFDHLYIVWNKADVVLDLEAGVPRISEHEITGAYMNGDKPF